MKTYGIVCDALNLEHKTGVERYLSSLLSAMMAQPLLPDERVLLYVSQIPKKGSPLLSREEGSGLEFGILPSGWEWRVLSSKLPGWTHLRLSWEMFRHPPQILFVPAHEVPLYTYSKTRVVATIHDVAFKYFPSAYEPVALRRQAWAVQHAIRYAKKIITVSETTSRDLEKFWRITFDRLRAIPLATDLQPSPSYGGAGGGINDALLRYRLTAGQYFFYLGRLESKKNIVTLIRAFVTFKQQLGIGSPIKLVLAGKFGFGQAEIQSELKSAGDDIIVLGFIPDADAAALLKGSLALCFPSLYEGFGLPILEAFAAGVPVIASNIPSSREVAANAAIFVDPNDTPGLVRAMQTILHEPQTRADLALRGTRRLADFSWQKTAQKTWEVLRSV
jgi:glycosyltransferase involved in cell wall biosynthesis